MVQPITEHHTVVRPTMIPRLKEEGNRGTEVIMVSTGNYDPLEPIPEPEPEPEREPITVTTSASWADLNSYLVGETVYADVAHFEGGLEETTTYRWRAQTQVEGVTTNGKWTNYDDHAAEVSFELTEAGQVRFQCQARDTGVDPVEQVNSFASWQTVNEPPPPIIIYTTIGNITLTVNDMPYDHKTGPALTVLMNDPIKVTVDHDGDASPTKTWDARNDYPLEVTEESDHYMLTLPQAGPVTATVVLQDSGASDSPQSAVINFYVVDAKTWSELKESADLRRKP